jgi:uncharacterized protein YcfJ
LLASAIAIVPMATQAEGTNSVYYLNVPVVRVDPVYSSRNIEHPVRVCRTEIRNSQDQTHRRFRNHYDDYDRPRDRHHAFVPGLIGGLVGGLIGNQFGGGRGKKALTVVGALAGSSIARDIARGNERRYHRDYDYRETTPTEVCRTTYDSQVVDSISGYDVTYEYDGQQFNKRVSEHPGDEMRIRVQLSPLDS